MRAIMWHSNNICCTNRQKSLASGPDLSKEFVCRCVLIPLRINNMWIGYARSPFLGCWMHEWFECIRNVGFSNDVFLVSIDVTIYLHTHFTQSIDERPMTQSMMAFMMSIYTHEKTEQKKFFEGEYHVSQCIRMWWKGKTFHRRYNRLPACVPSGHCVVIVIIELSDVNKRSIGILPLDHVPFEHAIEHATRSVLHETGAMCETLRK